MPVARTHALQQTVAEWVTGQGPTTPEPTQAAFGTGGLTAGGDPRAPTGAETSLGSEQHRNADVTPSMDGIEGVVEAFIDGDVAGSLTINEAGLFDAAGNLLAYATFTPRAVSPGVRLDFRFRL